ncbi:MAG: hypothetical protein GY841_20960 [FCB group bacterium]|nr:hypothetical protein [FCB group bacterium]
MLLRTMIFRYLVLFALIPPVIMALVSYYMIAQAVDQAEMMLASSAPDRTINSLRLMEDYLQQSIRGNLSSAGQSDRMRDSGNLHWRAITVDGETQVITELTEMETSIRSVLLAGPGPIRKVIGTSLIIGYAEEAGTGLVAGGFIFDREYLSGFEAASQSLSESREYKNILPAFIFFAGAALAAVLLAVLLAAYILSRRLSASITNPLERLDLFAGTMARGELPQQLVLAGTEEVVNLSATFNRMANDLEQSRRRLMAVERVAAWQGFARRMAHELKNPLTPISISLYRIQSKLKESGGYDPYAEAFEAITAEVEHLRRLAADYSSLAGLPEPKFVIFDFDQLADEVLRLFDAQLAEFAFKNLSARETGEINGDPDRLREVMVNLLNNAMAFAPPKGRISISCGKEEDSVWFMVANENRDRAAAEVNLRSAKMPYFSTREGGSGLGLAVAEKIILDHGGTLTLRLQGEMTEARFDLPMDRPIDE